MPSQLQIRRLLLMGSDKNSLIVYTAADNTSTFDPSWIFSAGGGPMTVDWGDGSPRESHAIALSHTYANGSTKAVKFTCPDWATVTTFNINIDVCKNALPDFSKLNKLTVWAAYSNQFSGTLPSFAACTALTTWLGDSNQFSGVLPSFAACTALTTWQGKINQFSDVLPSFATCTLLTLFFGYNNQFNGYQAGGFATQKDLATLSLQTNQFPVASIDAILADLVTSLGIVGRVVCTVNLAGVGNAAPSNPAGLASKATLVAAGWTVTTN